MGYILQKREIDEKTEEMVKATTIFFKRLRGPLILEWSIKKYEAAVFKTILEADIFKESMDLLDTDNGWNSYRIRKVAWPVTVRVISTNGRVSLKWLKKSS